MKISVYVPISPNIGFLSRVKWIRKSLDHLGSPYSEAIIHVILGYEDNGQIGLNPKEFTEFSANKHRYRFHSTNRQKFNKYSHLETAATRFMAIDDADISILCDADVMFIKRFDELIELVQSNEGIYGVIAHASPFTLLDKMPNEWWESISVNFCNEEIKLSYSHSKQPDIQCPAYYNNGFIIGDNKSWKKIKEFCYQRYGEVCQFLPEKYNGRDSSPRFFTLQIILSLALLKFGIKTQPISEIYNFPNDQLLSEKFSSLLSDIRIIHYLRTNHFDRERIFTKNVETNRFLLIEKIDLVSSILQKHVSEIIENQGYD
ncbi:MAG: hypothetical protein GY816_04305 [Cytophagales bacterium]|nr:hypothetical protein [Cytophagales bacterium]